MKRQVASLVQAVTWFAVLMTAVIPTICTVALLPVLDQSLKIPLHGSVVLIAVAALAIVPWWALVAVAFQHDRPRRHTGNRRAAM